MKYRIENRICILVEHAIFISEYHASEVRELASVAAQSVTHGVTLGMRFRGLNRAYSDH